MYHYLGEYEWSGVGGGVGGGGRGRTVPDPDLVTVFRIHSAKRVQDPQYQTHRQHLLK